MPNVVGISLRVAGKIYFFDPGAEAYFLGERVLVETARGTEIGTVRLPPHDVPDDAVVPPLKRVLRRVVPDDLERDARNRDRESLALEACKRQVARLNLPMRLIDAQYSFDGTHVLINFQAESRVDFRELVRELARELHARIELRQVGVRDEAKLIDGYGMCGRRLCCASFLTSFAPVAINMAKAQGLALNPQKISGSCGRLMCCLAFEFQHYSELRVGMPKVNAHIDTPRGSGKVTKINALARQVEVAFPGDDTPIWFRVDELAGGAPLPAAGGCPGCGGECPGHHATLEESSAGTIETAPPASPADDENHRNRHRRRRPSGGMGPKPDAPAQPPAESTAPAADGPSRRRRRRGGGGRPAGDGAPQPGGQQAPPPPGDGSADPNRKIPSGRYRPRRRR